MRDEDDYFSMKRKLDEMERQHKRTNMMALAIVALSIVLGIGMMIAFT